MTSFALDRLVWGEDERGGPSAQGAHRTNLILHAAATLCVYALLRGRPARAWTAAFFGALVFAVHPVQTEAVVHIVGRADLLCALFFLLGWLCQSAAARWPAALCCFAALCSKETAVVLPAVLFAEAAVQSRRGWTALVREQARALWPCFAALGLYVLARGLVLGPTADPPRAFAFHVPGQFVAFADPDHFEVPLTMLHAFGEYLRLLIWPAALSADYSGFPHHRAVSPAVAASAAALIALCLGALAAWKRGARWPSFWLAFFLLALAPVSNLIAASGIVMAERALYLPLLAFAALSASLFGRVAEKSRPLSLMLLGIPLLYAARSIQRTRVWSDPLTLFEETVSRGRYSGHIARNGLVGEYARMLPEPGGEPPPWVPRVLEEAREAFAAHPSWLNRYYLALFLEHAGELEQSHALWQSLRREDPASAEFELAATRTALGMARGQRNAGNELAALRTLLRAASLPRSEAALPLLRELDQELDATLRVLFSGADAALAMQALVVLELEQPDHELTGERGALIARAREENALSPLHARNATAAGEGDWPGAAELTEAIALLDPATTPLAQRIETVEKALAQLLERGQVRRARAWLQRLLAMDPGNRTGARAEKALAEIDETNTTE
jgi:hypothetical protein